MSAAWPGSSRSGAAVARCYVDVWQSKDQWESFTGNRLHPVVHPILQDTLGFVPPEPPRTVLDVIDAWTDRHPS